MTIIYALLVRLVAIWWLLQLQLLYESGSLVVEDEYHSIFHCSLYDNIRDQFVHHVGNTILNINEKNEIDKIKMSKEFVGYFAKIISDMIEVRHHKLFVKT